MPDYVVSILYRPPDQQPCSAFQPVAHAEENVQMVDEALRAAGFTTQIILVGGDIEAVLDSFNPRRTVIFNYCDGYHENSSGYDPITRLYESLNLAYTGADDQTLWGAQDKAHTKTLLVRHGVPTPVYRIFDTDAVADWRIFPALVKPARLHASLGILPESVVETSAGLRRQVQRVLDELGQPALVEDYIEGDEYRVSLWGNYELEMLPIIHYHFLPSAARPYGFKDYVTKWDETGLHVEVTARLNGVLKARIDAVSKAACRAVGVRDYGGIDIRVRRNRPYVIDPNQNPSIAEDSSFFRSARAAGHTYASVIARIVELAAARRPR
jgi:D-alanine-D-alanine ligase